MNDVVWTGHDGYDNGGSATLGIEFNKILGIKTLFKDKETKEDIISTYKNIEDLRNILWKIKPKVILFYLAPTKEFEEYKDFFEVIFEFQNKLKTKIIAIDCTRKGVLIIKNDTQIQEDFKLFFKYKFDYIWSFSGESKKYWLQFTKNYKLIDINLYSLTNKEINNKENNIGYIARFHAVKGINKLIKSFESTDYVHVKYPYIYIGNDHDVTVWNNKHKLGGPIYVVNQYAKTIKDKTPKDCYSIKSSILEEITNDKINIYPRYNFHEKEEVFRKIGIAICPTLARETKKDVNHNISLFPSITNNKKDKQDKYIEKNKKYWSYSMEYVNYEFIDYGIPVMFSRDYCLTYDPEMINIFPELIYDNLEDCLIYCQNNYETLLKSAPKQKEWLRNKLDSINNIVKKELEELLNKKRD